MKEALMTLDEMFAVLDAKQRQLEELQAEVDDLHLIMTQHLLGHCCKVSDEAAFCLIQRPYISKTLLTRRISPRGSP